MTAEQLVMYWIGRIATDALVSLATIMLCNYLYNRYRKYRQACQMKRQEHIRTKLANRVVQRQAERSRRKDFVDLMEASK
jgi:hypothetical protein